MFHVKHRFDGRVIHEGKVSHKAHILAVRTRKVFGNGPGSDKHDLLEIGLALRVK